MKSTQLHFSDISLQTFLDEYWQKKPVVLKQAIPQFISPISPEELAGLSLEAEVESRIVTENSAHTPAWQLRQGPFTDADYKNMPSSHWTLLVQAVDTLIPEIQDLLNLFDFIPQWRADDIMISYATLHGSVGPHYDNYDVFLLQALGQRKWHLTTQHCNENNYLDDVDIRIMKTFNVEQEYILNPGDILYLPPHVGHHGVSASDDCMTYSFGYRSYKGLEVLNSFCEHLSEEDIAAALYKDPAWSNISKTSELPDDAWRQAGKLLSSIIADENNLKNWFGKFATSLDYVAESQLPLSLEEVNEADFIAACNDKKKLRRNPFCKIAYRISTDTDQVKLYINGDLWQIKNVCYDLILLISNQRIIPCKQLMGYLDRAENIKFLFGLWQRQWLSFDED
jgi:50S ribosomal protein L16 3-hydroxylase